MCSLRGSPGLQAGSGQINPLQILGLLLKEEGNSQELIPLPLAEVHRNTLLVTRAGGWKWD